MEVSVFKGAKDTAPQNIAVSWEDVCALASDLMAVEFTRSNKTSHHAMIFGRCEGRRSNANVRFLSGLCADFDIGPADPRYLSFQDRCDQLEAAGLKFIAYTTTKNSAGHNKYRLIMPYGRNVEPERCTAAWHASNAKLDGAIDASTKDAARLSFMPARWTENPFWDESKAMTVTLVDPFNAMRVNRGGAPILSAADIDGLSVVQATGGQSTTKSPRPFMASADHLGDAERQLIAKGHGPDAPVWAWLASLRGPLVRTWMVRDLPQQEGSRDYRFMLAVAHNAITNGLPISADVLIVLAEQFSTECLGRAPGRDLQRQAENALAWAFHQSGHAPEPCQPVNAGTQP